MKSYNPTIPPDPTQWLELDEQLRIALIEDYHRSGKIEMPGVTSHAGFHVIVENQLAMGLQSTVTTVARLMRQGVSRHNAIHAIGYALVEHISEAAKTTDPNYADIAEARFEAGLARLRARDWKKAR
jgi:hypothetical protein